MKILKRKKPEQPSVRSPRDPSARAAPVFSYYSKRAPDNESQIRTPQADTGRQKKKTTWLGYLPSIVSSVGVIGAFGYVTTLATNPRVSIINNPDKPVVVQSAEVYERAAADLMQGSLLNRSKLTINTDMLAKQLQSNFPELGDVVVTIPLIGRRPIIETRPATPILILAGKGGSFVIDSQGRPVLKASQLASSVRDNLPVVTDSSDSDIELGKQLFTTELVAFIKAIQGYTNAQKLTVESYALPAITNELHIRLAGKGYVIKFNTELDARQQIGTYIALQERLDSEGKVPSEYIDVRVEERAYYK